MEHPDQPAPGPQPEGPPPGRPAGPRRLSHGEVVAQLVDLPGWDHTGGALHARFDAPDVPAAVSLVSQAFEAAEEMDHHPDTDLRWKRVRFELTTHDADGVTQLDVELAHRIDRAALALGAQRLPAASDVVEIGIDTARLGEVSPFWQAALGYRQRHEGDPLVLVDPHGRGPQVWFQESETPGAPSGPRNRLHVDVTVATLETAAERRSAVEAAGGRLLTDEFAPAWWVYADAEGNEVCICTLFGREG